MKIASDLNLRNVETVERLEAIRLPLSPSFRILFAGEFKNSIKFEKFAAAMCRVGEILFGGRGLRRKEI